VGVAAAAIHGDKSQGQRERALAAFKGGEVRALVATDIAARGIDIDAVSHVFNHDLPYVPEAYVHRIGRTARAGAEGIAISLVADDERGLLKDIQRVTRQTIPSFDRRNDRALGAAMAADAQIAPPAERERERNVPRAHGRPSGGQGHGGGQGQGGGQGAKNRRPNRSFAGGRGGGNGGANGGPRHESNRPQGRTDNARG
jgi:ATP-dependent RNA helicase RhlE